MEQTPEQRMYTAISQGSAEQARQILAVHPEVLHDYPGVAPSWFHYAARKGYLAIIDVFLAAGLPVDHRLSSDGDTPLNSAVAFGQIETAKLLLSLKANPNSARMLIGAINSKNHNLALVKLLVEHGADVNLCWRWQEEKNGCLFNALSWAVDGGHQEIADYLRENGAVLPPLKQNHSPNNIEDEVTQYFNSRIGHVRPTTMATLLPIDYPVSIHIIPPDGDLSYYTLFTAGMSRQPMTVPTGSELYQFAELAIHLPGNWNLSQESLEESQWRWPVDLLRKVAVYPHKEKTWLGGPIAIFANEDPPLPLASGCPFAALLLAANYENLGPIQKADGTIIQIYTVLPLFREERELEIKKDLSTLFRRLDQYSVSKIVDVHRHNVGCE